VRLQNVLVNPPEEPMPLVTLTVRKPKNAAFKSSVLDGIHAALVASGVPADDLFQRVLELDAENFRFDPSYPGLATARGEDFVLVEILLSVGRSVKVKKKIVADIVAALGRAPGIHADRVMVVFKETLWENWSFGGGQFIHT
jgi:phenylpyruvate tautomerase PptA (4-oxalocrotonate tautomerase family)